MPESLLIPILIASSASSIGLGIAQAVKDTPPPPGMPEQPASIGNEGALRAEKEAEMRRRRLRQGGRSSTIMSGSPLGVTGQSNRSARKYLTGA